MRVLTGHKVNGCNDGIDIQVVDEPGSGGANHLYVISGFNTATNPSGPNGHTSLPILFQNGPILEFGVNGITHENLLAILIDRMEGFQRGPFACDENAAALTAMQTAQGILKARTEKRLARGVEGTHKV